MACHKGLLLLFMIAVIQLLALASPILAALAHTTNYLVSRAQAAESALAAGEEPDVFASTLTPPPTTVLASATVSVYTSLSFIIVPQLGSTQTITQTITGTTTFLALPSITPSVFITSPPATGTSMSVSKSPTTYGGSTYSSDTTSSTPSVFVTSPVSHSTTASAISTSIASTSTPTSATATLRTEPPGLSAAIGGSVGGGAVVLLLILVVCLRQRHKRKAKIALERSLGSGNLDHGKNHNEPLHQRVVSWIHKTPSTPGARSSFGLLRRGNSVATSSGIPSHSYAETPSEYYPRSPNLYTSPSPGMPTRSPSNNSTAVAPGSVHKFPSLDQARVAYTPTGSPPTRPTNRPNSLTPSVIEVMDEAFSKRDSHGDTIGPLEVGSTRFSGAAGVRSPPPVGGYRNLHSRLTDEERCQVPPQPYRPGHQRNFTEPTVPPQGAFSDRSITPEPLRIVKRSVSDAKAHNGHQSSFKIEDFAGLYENGKQRFDDPDESDEEKKAKLREEAFNTLEGNPPARRQIASSIYSRTMSGVPGYNQQGQSSRHAERTIHEERARHTSHGSEEVGRDEQLAAEIDEDLRNHRDDSEDPEDHDNLYDA